METETLVRMSKWYEKPETIQLMVNVMRNHFSEDFIRRIALTLQRVSKETRDKFPTLTYQYFTRVAVINNAAEQERLLQLAVDKNLGLVQFFQLVSREYRKGKRKKKQL